MMKTPEDIIQETINMIDEYEAKIEEENKLGRKQDKIIKWASILIALIIASLIFIVL